MVDGLKDIIPKTYVIGDCSNVGGTLWQSVRSGFEMAEVFLCHFAYYNEDNIRIRKISF
ncbi:hypothetical protein [Butyrivibrio sp. YAB3001]|uniref:hypothetical protein n=1 Tax=Butyrivibrio sp. YAB3001 TaxID=1520812 RepID=UPI0015880A24|nr:hypothetical protein [Butyrivibrio sp. YAB3001]